MNTLFTVVGGQFGSEAKGHFAAALALREVKKGRKVIAVRVAGPNAGHTAYDPKGRPFALRTIPAMAVVDPTILLVIAPGSEVELDVLIDEVNMLENAGIPVRNRLFIDPEATVLTEAHKRAESPEGLDLHHRIGSTGKGIGACRADRIMRQAVRVADVPMSFTPYGQVLPAARLYNRFLVLGIQQASIIIEGTQGYGLGLHAGHYPQCTSSDTRAIDFLAMADISPWHQGVDNFENWIVMRTFPIRVAGNSGKLFDERSWESLADDTNGYIKPERTTVTKKIRRIGGWDPLLAQAAVEANGPKASRVALSFLDYVDPSIAGVDTRAGLSIRAMDFIDMVELNSRAKVQWVSTGPNSSVWL